MGERPPRFPADAAFFENSEHFFVALSSPLRRDGRGYYALRRVADRVRYLRDGSQVFVVRRTAFGETADQQEVELVDFTYGAVEEEGFVPDIAIRPVSELNGNSSNGNGNSHG